jgi:hypothetical protein
MDERVQQVVPVPAPPSRALPLQLKLAVGRSDDPLEVEADRMADEVLGRIRRSTSGDALFGGPSPATRIARRTGGPSGMVGPEGGPLDASLESAIRRSGGEQLDRSTRATMEHGFGADFGAVRIHRNSDVAPQLSATAFTVGSDIHFAPGTYAPGSATGQRLLGHELAHVVQQGGGAMRTIRRKLSGGDTVSLKATFGTKEVGKAALAEMGEHAAYQAIRAWVTKRGSGKTAPTIAEVAAWYEVTATEPPAPLETGGYHLDLMLLDTAEYEIGFDDHQNKHQHPQLGELSVYKGGKAISSYSSKTSTIAWHKQTTAPIMVTWLRDLDKKQELKVGRSYVSKTGEDLFKKGHLFVASATKDSSGKLYGSYHCYPG